MSPALVIDAKVKDIVGFAVRRALPTIKLRSVGPFVFLDQMGPAVMRDGQGLDVPPHPHIGLSTMTYLFEGEILHRDSLGTVQMIRPGAVNWMTAGRGIAHSERTPPEARHGGKLSGIQFWVALPESHEEMAPTFLHLEAAALPVVEDDGIAARIIAGDAFGAHSPLGAPHPMICVDIDMTAGTRLDVPPTHPELALYVAAGEVELADTPYRQGQLLVLAPGASETIRATSKARMMLLGGERLDGPRHIWWNFVSSSKDRIEQAKDDWKHGRFPPVPGEAEFIPLPE
jgi:redox-sensitive bicupin YhaK (pirin superfamily)